MKESSQKKVLKEFLNNRGSLIEIIIVAIILGIGIEFLSITYFSLSFRGQKSNEGIDSFILIDTIKKSIVPITNYDYLNRISRDLDSATVEDEALKIDWEESISQDNKSKDKEQKFTSLINQLTEYYILETISTHLTDFFNGSKLDKDQIVEFDRNDIPAILLRVC